MYVCVFRHNFIIVGAADRMQFRRVAQAQPRLQPRVDIGPVSTRPIENRFSIGIIYVY